MNGQIDIAVPADVQEMHCACGCRGWTVLIHPDSLVWGVECSHCGAGMLLDEGWLHGGTVVEAGAS